MLLEDARKDAAGKRLNTPGVTVLDGRTASTGSASSTGDSTYLTETVATKPTSETANAEVWGRMLRGVVWKVCDGGIAI